jgi:hypothetical protein
MQVFIISNSTIACRHLLSYPKVNGTVRKLFNGGPSRHKRSGEVLLPVSET